MRAKKRLCYSRPVRAVPILLLATLHVAAQGGRGKVVEGEIEGKPDPLAYAVYVATTAPKDKPAPLILAVHAGQGSARQFVGFLRSLAEANGAILAGPRGLRELIGADGWWWKDR